AANTAHRMNYQTGFKIVSAVDNYMAIDLPLDTQIAHPMDRRTGLLHQSVGELLVDPAAGDPLKISAKLFSRVGGKMKLLKHRIAHSRQKPANLVGAGKTPAKAGVKNPRVPPDPRPRRFLQHDASRRGRLSRCDRRFESSAAAADNYNRDVFSPHGS